MMRVTGTQLLAEALGITKDEAKRRIEDVARHMGVTPGTVRRWILNGNIRLDAVSRFSPHEVKGQWRRRRRA